MMSREEERHTMSELERIIKEICNCNFEMIGYDNLYADEQKNSIIVDPGWQDWRDHKYLSSVMCKFFDNREIDYREDEVIYEQNGSDGYAAKHIFTLTLKIEDDVLVKICSQKKHVKIPENVKRIEATAYSLGWGSSLESVELPHSLVEIGSFAFRDCEKLEQISIPEGVVKIGKYAFNKCISLKTIELPKSLVEIEENAFSRCIGLRQITIPDGVKVIGKNAFSECINLEQVSLPKTLNDIGTGAFHFCNNLSKISIDEGNTCLSLDNGCLIHNTGNDIVLIRSIEGSSIPEGISKIGDGAFSGRTEITEAIIPDSVTVIGKRAFTDCTELKTVTLPSRIKEIAASAFAYCEKLSEISIPEGVEIIGVEAFLGCNGLKKIVLPDTIQIIESYAFFECFSLTDISIPSSLTELGSYAFNGTGLTHLFIPKELKSIGEAAFSNCSNLTDISCSEGNKTYRAEGNCLIKKKNLILGCNNSEIPQSITSIGDRAFQGRNGLTNIIIPENITKIGDCAFKDCKGLISITIPDSVKKIGYSLVGEDTVIKAARGSAAEKYAKKNGIKYEPI